MKTLIAAFALAAFSSVLPSTAHACGMSVRMEQLQPRPTPPIEISNAEKAANEGASLVAARKVLSVFPQIRSATAGHDPLETRALRVLAVSIARSESAVQPGWSRFADLSWAEQAMREIDAKRPNDPSVQADLGEVLSRIPTKRDEAMKLLSQLAESDLMGSPHAYAALARLRSQRGDEAGSALALQRCVTMAGANHQSVCREKPSPKSVAPAKADIPSTKSLTLS